MQTATRTQQPRLGARRRSRSLPPFLPPSPKDLQIGTPPRRRHSRGHFVVVQEEISVGQWRQWLSSALSVSPRRVGFWRMAGEHHSLLPVLGPDGLARDAPVIAYTEKVIEEEQLQLKRYIKENYSKIRDVERELENLTLEMKLTAGPKKAALEHLRKKIELSTERILAAKIKEEQAKKVWEAAAKLVKDEEAGKQKLCDDLNQLVQESAASQFSRLEELKKRLEALNPSRASSEVSEGKSVQSTQSVSTVSIPLASSTVESAHQKAEEPPNCTSTSGEAALKDNSQLPLADIDGKGRKKASNLGRRKGNTIILKGRGSSSPGWTGAGFDVDGRA